MGLFIDLLVIGFLFTLLIWGAYAGWWTGMVAFVALFSAILVSARIDEVIAHLIGSFTAAPASPALEAVIYILLIVVCSGIAYSLIGLLLGFCRPRTHAAIRLFSSRIIGGIFGITSGLLFASIIFISLFLGTSTTTVASPTLHRAHTALVTGIMAPKIWSVVHVERNIYQLIFRIPAPPPFRVP